MTSPCWPPADGTVTYLGDGHPDLPVGSVDSQHPTGNQLVIDIGAGHYLLMGHLRQGSITVHAGEPVTEGQQIARAGKSGHTSHPHIHSHAQTLPNGIVDLTTIDGPKMLKTPAHLPAAALWRQLRAGLRRDRADGG
jgi:murein DD-endopeptidase MepM/ murein hydrolase activator NlpD